MFENKSVQTLQSSVVCRSVASSVLEKLEFGCHNRYKDMEAKPSFTLPVTFHCSFYLFTTLVTDFMAAAMGSFSFLSLSRNNDAGGQYFKYDGPVCQRLAPKHLLAV